MRLLRDQDVAPRVGGPGLVSADAAGAEAEVEMPRAPQVAPARVALRTRLGLAVLALAAAVALGWWATTTPGFGIRRVTVEGAVHADAAALAEQSGALGVNAFRADLEGVRRAMLADPWIAEARVRRVLPHELRVQVTERVPVGIRMLGKELALVDGEGRVLEDGVEAGCLPVPSIVGLDEVAPARRAARARLAAASLAAIRAASPRLYRATREIDVSRAERMTLVSGSLPPIWIAGPESADEAAGYACRVETVRRALGDVIYVDARWSHRLFVMPGARDRSTEEPGPARS